MGCMNFEVKISNIEGTFIISGIEDTSTSPYQAVINAYPCADITDWLDREATGLYSWMPAIGWRKDMWDRDCAYVTSMIYKFEKLNDALLFKLKWAQ